MRARRVLRWMVAVALGVNAAALAYYWPAPPRAVLQNDRICWHLAFTPDSSMLAALDRDAGLDAPGQVLVWDVATGQLRHRLDYGSRFFPTKLAFAPDGKTVSMVDAGRVVKWDLGSNRVVEFDHAHWSHSPNQSAGREVLFDANGRWLVHFAYEGQTFDVETGAAMHDYRNRFPDRSHYAQGGCIAACIDGKVKTFNAVTGAEIATFPMTVQPGTMARNAMSFSADGTHAVYVGDDFEDLVCNGVTGHCSVWGRDVQHRADVCLSADNRYLAVSIADGTGSGMAEFQALVAGSRWQLHVFDTTRGTRVGRPMAGSVLACFAPDGKTLAVADENQHITLWDWPPASRWPLALALGLAAMPLPWVIARCAPRRKAPSAVQLRMPTTASPE